LRGRPCLTHRDAGDEAIVVEEIAPFNGPVTVTVDGVRRAISREVAARVQIS
jgi:Fe2+ transport system protein FeoA